MNLSDADNEYLRNSGLAYTTAVDANMTCVVLSAYGLPKGYDKSEADLLIRLSPGYPDVPPDMWWFSPAIKLADGRSLPATEVSEDYLGRSWQRWSRHLSPGQWRSGSDSLRCYLALLGQELLHGVQGVAP